VELSVRGLCQSGACARTLLSYHSIDRWLLLLLLPAHIQTGITLNPLHSCLLSGNASSLCRKPTSATTKITILVISSSLPLTSAVSCFPPLWGPTINPIYPRTLSPRSWQRLALGVGLSPVYPSIASSEFIAKSMPSRRSGSLTQGYARGGHMGKHRLQRCWWLDLAWRQRPTDQCGLLSVCSLPLFTLNITYRLDGYFETAAHKVPCQDSFSRTKLPRRRHCSSWAHSHLPIAYCCSKRISRCPREPPAGHHGLLHDHNRTAACASNNQCRGRSPAVAWQRVGGSKDRMDTPKVARALANLPVR
jgi:hypothetical protein